MISMSGIKRGTCFKLDGDIFSVVEFLHVKPGKGAAFVRTKIKNIRKGTVIDRTFKSGEKLDDVRLEKSPMQYLYDEDDRIVFMNTETYEQESVHKETIGNAIQFMKKEDIIDIIFYEGEPVSVEPPASVTLKVTYAEPGIKGDTATNVLKPVKVETGADVKVPLFINEGDMIKINTETGEYIERVNK